MPNPLVLHFNNWVNQWTNLVASQYSCGFKWSNHIWTSDEPVMNHAAISKWFTSGSRVVQTGVNHLEASNNVAFGIGGPLVHRYSKLKTRQTKNNNGRQVMQSEFNEWKQRKDFFQREVISRAVLTMKLLDDDESMSDIVATHNEDDYDIINLVEMIVGTEASLIFAKLVEDASIIEPYLHQQFNDAKRLGIQLCADDEGEYVAKVIDFMRREDLAELSMQTLWPRVSQ